MASPDAVQSSDGTVRGSGLRRKSVQMFAEGSLLRWPNDGDQSRSRPFLGELADVTPDIFTAHPIWRYGLAYPVAFRAGGKEARDE
jgi:hypothetical protein